MPVPVSKPHRDSSRGDPMYDKTYKFGNTTVHVVAPPPMTDEELEQIEKEIHEAAWAILERIEREKREKEVKQCQK